MRPAVEEFPDMAGLSYGLGIGEIGFRLFTIAGIAARTEEPSFFVVSHATSELDMPVLAVQLATAVGRAADFRGVKFQYTRPGPVRSPPSGAFPDHTQVDLAFAQLPALVRAYNRSGGHYAETV